ncbi:HipA domain-containing protein [Mesobacillus subterraneus]|uniref:HipA domain-containing protein n=1 Tax=Mesobacillus subterraneus TaxID=285983 RepID=UPI001CFE74B8|nr:HipA domain-containing protein [Mesobacillus subterraneus]WLR55899.1 HipA domain-containing protein [Mesobacillus subterraneus]
MIKPVSYRRKLAGKSNAHLIAFDDGRDYVVKFLQTGFEKSLPNEWVAYCLARYLGLPVPFARLVEIPENFAAMIPDSNQFTLTQFQFASLYVPDCLDGHQVKNVAGIVNAEMLAGIILLDYWLGNRDRTRKNILLQEDTKDSYYLWIIDHAEILGSYNWEISGLEKLPIGLRKSAAQKLMAVFVENEDAFFEHLESIQTIPIFLIEEIVSTIPDDWMVTDEEKKAMVTMLLKRRKKVLPKLLPRFIKNVYRPLH